MAEAPPLAGIRIVERASRLDGAYAGFLLGALGADVVRVERPGATHARRDRAVHRGKRSVTLDLGSSDGRWAALVDGADAVVVDDDAPRVEPATGLVRCRVTAWGGTADLPPEEPLVAAATGMHAMQWAWDRQPVWLVTPMVSYMTGILAALGVTAAVYARGRGAPGQAVDVSGVAAAFALNSGTYVTGRETRGSLSQFGDPRGQIATYGIFRASDGWIFVGALTPAFVVKLFTVVDRVELLADSRLQGNPLAFGVPDTKAFVRRELDPIFAGRPAAEWVRTLRAADIPCGAVRSRADALGDPDARALGAIVAVDDPVLGPRWQPAGPAAFSDTPAPPPGPASLPGADGAALAAEPVSVRRAATAGNGPRACLDGIRVLDLASFIAGPFCPMLLAELGADVVKIESADGDPFRMAAFGFVGWNRGKRSLVVDLKRPEGRDVFLDLARRADVVVDNFRGGVMDRLGIGWERLRADNPRLVHTSITGYGSSGPLTTLPGFDPIFQAASGLMAAQGGADEPVFHMVAYNDYAAGALGALATVAALVARERTGRGQRVDVSLLRTSYVAQAAELVEGGVGGRDFRGPRAARRLYACRDGWLCVAARTAAEAAALGRLAGVAIDLADAPDGAAASAVARLLADLTRTEALGRLATAGVVASPCRSFEELLAEPAFRATGAIVEQVHPTLGPLLLPGPFVRFEATPAVLRRSAPLLGADGADVLAEIGYAAERVARLVADGVVGGGP